MDEFGWILLAIVALLNPRYHKDHNCVGWGWGGGGGGVRKDRLLSTLLM